MAGITPTEATILNAVAELREAREICRSLGLVPYEAEIVITLASRARMSSAIVAAIDRLTAAVKNS